MKRDHREMAGGEDGLRQSPFLPMFEQFRAELDEHHDRRERIIKASRDVTAASKKIIFTLQRVSALNQDLPQHVIKSNKPYYDNISTQLSSVSRDLQGINQYRYARQISGGCQEYIEAATFEHYITTATLMSYDTAVAKLRNLDPDGPGVGLTSEDYILGVYDMTGELMRFAITTMATTGALPIIPSPVTSSQPDAAAGADSQGSMDVDEVKVDDSSSAETLPQRHLLSDMRTLRSALEALETGSGPFAKEVDKKMQVMQTSVEKVERALYGLMVRGAERPKGWMPDTEAAGRAVEVEA